MERFGKVDPVSALAGTAYSGKVPGGNPPRWTTHLETWEICTVEQLLVSLYAL